MDLQKFCIHYKNIIMYKYNTLNKKKCTYVNLCIPTGVAPQIMWGEEMKISNWDHSRYQISSQFNDPDPSSIVHISLTFLRIFLWQPIQQSKPIESMQTPWNLWHIRMVYMVYMDWSTALIYLALKDWDRCTGATRLSKILQKSS